MLVDIGQGLLSDAKQSDLDIVRKPFHGRRDLKIYIDPTAVGKPFDIRAQREPKARFVEKRRVKKVRGRLQLSDRLLDDTVQLLDRLLIRFRRLNLQPTHYESRACEILPQAVVQSPCEAPPLLILNAQQRARELLHFRSCGAQLLDGGANQQNGYRESREEDLQDKNILFSVCTVERSRTLETPQDRNDRDHENRGARTFFAKSDGGPENERHRQIKKSRHEPALDRAKFGPKSDSAHKHQANKQYECFNLAACCERQPPGVTEPSQEHRTKRCARNRVGAVPIRPGDPVIRDVAIAQQRHKGTAERADGGAHDDGDQDIRRRLPKRAEIIRSANEVSNTVGIQHRHRAVGHEGDQILLRRHADANLRDNMGRKRSEEAEPPKPPWEEQQGAEQHDVRRPERRKDAVRQGAHIEGRFGTEIVANGKHYESSNKGSRISDIERGGRLSGGAVLCVPPGAPGRVVWPKMQKKKEDPRPTREPLAACTPHIATEQFSARPG